MIENDPYDINKQENDYTDDDWKKLDINEITMNILHCVMNENDFSRTYTYKTTKEIWDELEKKYEGTSRVRDTKISLLCGQFEKRWELNVVHRLQRAKPCHHQEQVSSFVGG